jgi:hypothetical protein
MFSYRPAAQGAVFRCGSRWGPQRAHSARFAAAFFHLFRFLYRE